MRLQQPGYERVLNVFALLAVPLFTWGVVADERQDGTDPELRLVATAVAVVATLVCPWLAWRCSRLRVVCDSRGVTVHGLFVTRTVPTRSIVRFDTDEFVSVPSFVAVSDGVPHHHYLVALATSERMLGWVREPKLRQRRKLRQWIKGHGGLPKQVKRKHDQS